MGVLAAAVVLVVVLELAAPLDSPMPMDHLTRTVEPAVVVVGAALVLVQRRVALPIQLLMMHLHQSRVCAWPRIAFCGTGFLFFCAARPPSPSQSVGAVGIMQR